MSKNISNNWREILKSVFESLSLRCPKCSKGKIFSSYLKLKTNRECESCSLKFEDFNVGDGPSYVTGFLICMLVPVLAITVEVIFRPTLLTHAVLWVSTILILTYIILIYSRSAFIHLEYKIRKLEKK